MQEESFIFSTRASRRREKSGISPTIQEGVSGNRNFQLEEVPTGLSRGKGSFLLGYFFILGHKNGVSGELQ